MYTTFKNRGPDPAALIPQKATGTKTHEDGLFLLKGSVNWTRSTNSHAALHDKLQKDNF